MSHEELTELMVEEAVKHGAEDVAVLGSLENTRMIRFSNNKISVVKAWRNLGINMIIAVKKRIVVSSFDETSLERSKESVRNLIKVAKRSKPNYDYASLPKGPFDYEIRELHEDMASLDESELVAYAETAIDSALHEGAKRVAGTLICQSHDISLKTSANASGKDRTSSLEIFVRAFVTKESSGQGISCSTTRKDFHPEKAGQESARIAKMAKNPKTISGGRYDVVFGPSIFANLMNNVMDAASAFNVDAGLSFLVDKIGSEVASPQLTIIDEGNIPYGLNSRTFDDEGVPTRKTIVIDRGKLRSLLHNSTTAKKFNTSTTGNAGWIAPSAWNITIEKGNYRESELFEKMGEGLYITNNWYTRFQDYRNGDFSSVCRDGIFKIRNGKVDSSLKDIRISDNMSRIIKNVEATSNTRYWVKWWEVSVPTLTPYVLVRDVGVTKSVF